MDFPAITIRPDDLTAPEVIDLLRMHLEDAFQHSPPESVHSLPPEALRSDDLTLWSAWAGPRLLGCGALKEIDAVHGEIKAMHTVEESRGRGVGAAILTHIIAEAQRRGYRRLSLETGSMDAYAPARALYARFGFVVCEPFANYQPDPYSTFMTLQLTG